MNTTNPNKKYTLYKASRHTKKAPCPNLGIHASAMKTRSILQAIIGSCLTFDSADGAFVGFPSVIRRSIRSWRFDSHLFGSPINRIAENIQRYSQFNRYVRIDEHIQRYSDSVNVLVRYQTIKHEYFHQAAIKDCGSTIRKSGKTLFVEMTTEQRSTRCNCHKHKEE